QFLEQPVHKPGADEIKQRRKKGQIDNRPGLCEHVQKTIKSPFNAAEDECQYKVDGVEDRIASSIEPKIAREVFDQALKVYPKVFGSRVEVVEYSKVFDIINAVGNEDQENRDGAPFQGTGRQGQRVNEQGDTGHKRKKQLDPD